MDAFSEQILSAMEYKRQRSVPPEGFPSLPVIAADGDLDPDFYNLNGSVYAKNYGCMLVIQIKSRSIYASNLMLADFVEKRI